MSGICIFTDRNELVYVNVQATKMLEIGGGDLGKPIDKIRPEIAVLFNDSAGDRFFTRDISFSSKAGETRWIICDICRIGSSDGPHYRIVSVTDITRLKNLELKFEKSEKNLISIINNIPDVVYRLNPESNISFISDEIQKYGYNPEELKGLNICSLIHPDDRNKSVYRLNERRTGERRTKSFEVRLLLKSSAGQEYRLFSVNAEGLYNVDENGNLVFDGTQGIARDISQKRITEYALSESEEKRESVLNGLEDGYYEVDTHGNFVYLNTSLCKIAGYDKDEMLGKNYKSFFTEETAGIISRAFTELFKTGISKKLAAWTTIRKDGKKRVVEGSASIIKGPDGKTVGFRGIVRDITEKKKLENELLQARKLEAVGILAGGIAHDYNNALTAILGNLTLAKLEIGEGNKSLMEILNDAESASLRVMELTKRLGTFARGGKPNKKKCSILKVIEETVEREIVDYSGRIIINSSGGLWDVEVDDFQIGHVFVNIIDNSKEAAPEGGEIVVSVENVKVDREESHHEITLEPGDYLMISIRDNGPGITPDDINKIFDPYFTTKDMSSGLGLATSYAIIKRHYGYIDVESAPGNGSVFFIYLPAYKGQD
ncbi:MAG: PAS domain S-box protein [Spirochaetes bacterium]|nr:PAS domain S-box protein [Spirochaetota bacterium]